MAVNNRKKWVGVGGGAGLAIVLLVLLADRDQAPIVPVAKVTRENLSASITSNGKVEPISGFVARAEFPTFVAKTTAAEGQALHRGQVILTLESADVRAQLSEARAKLIAAQSDFRNARAGGPPDVVAQLQGDLEKARAQVANLERTQRVLEQLAAQHAATEDELAQNQSNLAQARASLATVLQKKDALARSAGANAERASLQVKQLQDQIDALDEKVRSATVTAPSDEMLYSLAVHQGDYVQVGQVLAEMADLRRVRVRAFVDEPDLGSLEPHQAVQVTWDAKPGKTWTGNIGQVPMQVVARNTRSVGEVLCEVDNAQLELLPNVNVEVRILVRERLNALVVPRAAVRYDNGRHFVFVVGDGKIHRRDISVGIGGVAKYEVVAGLAEGDRVALLTDQQQLRDGMDIHAAEAK